VPAPPSATCRTPRSAGRPGWESTRKPSCNAGGSGSSSSLITDAAMTTVCSGSGRCCRSCL
jgi:hypothetical protein